MAFGLGSIVRSVINPINLAQLAMGPAGWASLAVKTFALQLGSQMIQNIGSQLGLPQSVISAAQLTFGQSAGFSGFPGISPNGGINSRGLISFLTSQGMQPREAASFVRDLQQQARDTMIGDMKNSIQDFINDINRRNDRSRTEANIAAVMKGKGSILMKLAVALGMVADQKMNDMASKAEQIGNMGKIKAGNQAKFTQMNAELQALGQELNVVSQGLSNVLKSVGEANATLARKG